MKETNRLEINKFLDEYRTVGESYAEAVGDYTRLSETKSSILAIQATDQYNLLRKQDREGNIPESKIDRLAKATKEYLNHLKSIGYARYEMESFKIQLNSMDMEFKHWQSEAATARNEYVKTNYT